MQKIDIIRGTARTVVIGDEYVFKIPTGATGIEENESEVELGEKTRLVTRTTTFEKLGIKRLNIDELLELGSESKSLKLSKEKIELDDVLLCEIICTSKCINQVIDECGNINIGSINVQKRSDLDSQKILTKLYIELMKSGLMKKYIKLIDTGICNSKDLSNLRHTLASFRNYGIGEKNMKIELIDGGVIGKGKQFLIENGDLIYNFMNEQLLASGLLFEYIIKQDKAA